MTGPCFVLAQAGCICLGQAASVDVIGEVDEDAFGLHAERGGNELGVHRVNQIGKAGYSQPVRGDACRFEDMGEVGRRRRCPQCLGPSGDDDVRVAGAQLLAVGEASFQRRPADRIERDRLRPVTEPDAAGSLVDIVQAQQPQFPAGGPMEQGQQAEQRFMGMHSGVSRPAAEQGALVVQGDGASAEVRPASGGHAAGWIHQDDPGTAGDGEELPQHAQVPRAHPGLGSEECLHVGDVDQRPVLLAALGGQKQREVTHGRQRRFNGAVRAWLVASLLSTVPDIGVPSGYPR